MTTRNLCVFPLVLLWLLAPAAAFAASPAADRAAACAVGDCVFSQPEQPAPPGHPVRNLFGPRWQRVTDAEAENPSFTAQGENFNRVDAAAWRNLIRQAASKPETEVLQMVNGYFNQWQPKSDAQTWATPEYWATPCEFMKNRGGDCEDYAIAKYYALRYLGFEAGRLRVVIVRAREIGGRGHTAMHAVLAVHRPDGRKSGWFILDNNARPRDNIFPHGQYQGRFEPIYSMNEDGAWLHGDFARPD